MKSRSFLFMLSVIVAMIVLAACGAAAQTEAPATEAPAAIEAPAIGIDEFGAVEQSADSAVDGEALPKSSDALLPLPTMAAFEIGNPSGSGENTVVQNTNRKIIKNADVRLLVKDTEVAVNRSTQIISDLGGYLVSSRIWYQDYYGNNLMYATLTLGIPVDEFERALTRMRELSIRVLDETAAGEDVTEQYVDLQSQLVNLEATRARIQEFLTDAKTVDEALRINQELANIEAQIEQIKGQMNYISDRSAFSTITVNFEPEFPILTPTPTATAYPTATPIPWKPGDTFNDAKGTVTVAYQGIANFLIWFVVVILPIVLPPALILWALWKFMNRKTNRPIIEKAEGD
ncbi:MAG: DUF4349 domain-containing protein [Chloroflexota bacterium]|nr:DUF4349 domain-containing protein [Chloroflexota bacterium]